MDIYVDVDNTICHTAGTDYPGAKPIPENIARFNKLFDEGNRIVYWTARGMKSGINWRELTEKQFKEWGVKYHELRLDKPSFDVFIDDRVINSRDWEKGKWING
jgi:hypothetical protein